MAGHSPALIDLTGQRFGRWTVIERAENRDNRVFWLCKCDCGGIKAVPGKTLRNGDSKSCGCLRRENKGRPAGGYHKINTAKNGWPVPTADARSTWRRAHKIRSTAPTCRRIVKKVPTPYDALNNPDISKCRTCKYREYYNATIDGKQYYGCQYLNMTGEIRPCKPGKDCAVYEKLGRKKRESE